MTAGMPGIDIVACGAPSGDAPFCGNSLGDGCPDTVGPDGEVWD
jgi:hypothetical protein